jgi:NNP family nitrate/nitrite transporter-like MFS transporter
MPLDWDFYLLRSHEGRYLLRWFPVLLRCKQGRRKERSPMQREDTSKVAVKKSASDEDRSAEEVDARSLRAQLSPIFFLTVIFSLNFVSRIILSPLLPTIEQELGISHSQAGFFFFLSSGGYLVGLLSSGFFTSRSTHRLAIVVSIAGIGVAMLAIAAATNLLLMRCALIGLGFAAGLYLPSAIATITSLVDRQHWGKAIAVHELAPNLAFFIGPFIAELFLTWSSWRTALSVLGALSILASVSFGQFGQGGDFPGSRQYPARLGHFSVRLPSGSWLFFSAWASARPLEFTPCCRCILSLNGTWEPSWTNTIVAFSRSPGPIFGLLGGWASDKLGAKQTIVVSLGFTGLATLLVGLTSDTWLSLVVLLQPLLAVWFFQQRSRQSP